METESLKQKTEQFTSHLGDYAETFLKLTAVKATQKGSNIASAAITGLLLAGVGLFALFFAGFALGWWLGDVLDNRTTGFAIVAGFYLLLFIVGLALRKNTIRPYFRNTIVKRVYE